MNSTLENLQTFFDTVSDFLFVLGCDGKIQHVNSTVTRRLEYSEDELRTMSVLDVHPPGRRTEAAAIVQAMLCGEREYCPIPLQAKSGQLIPVETRVSKGRWDGKEALFGVSKDITDLKRSEEKFSRAFQNSAALMAISTVSDGRFFDVNEAFLETTGYKRDEIIGHTSDELGLFVYHEDRQHARRIFEQQGRVKNVEVQIKTRDGEIRDGLFSVDRIDIGSEECWLTVMTDLTENKRAEQKLKESQKKLKSIFESVSNVALILTDSNTDNPSIQEFSPGAENIFGYSREELLGKSVAKLHTEQDVQKFPSMFEQMRKRQKGFSGESILVRKNGERFPALFTTHPVFNSHGELTGTVGVTVDISVRKEAEKAQRRSENFLRSTLNQWAVDEHRVTG